MPVTWGYKREIVTAKIKTTILVIIIALSFVCCGLSDPALDPALEQDTAETRQLLEVELP